MKSAAIAVPRADRPIGRRLIEWLAPWYDVRRELARAARVDAAVAHAERSAKSADAAVRESRDELRASFQRAADRLGRP